MTVVYSNNKLQLEGQAIEEIAQTHGTPLMVYPSSSIAENHARLQGILISSYIDIAYEYDLPFMLEEQCAPWFDQVSFISFRHMSTLYAMLDRPTKHGSPKLLAGSFYKTDEDIKALLKAEVEIIVFSMSELNSIVQLVQNGIQNACLILAFNQMKGNITPQDFSEGIPIHLLKPALKLISEHANISVKGCQLFVKNVWTKISVYKQALEKLSLIKVTLQEKEIDLDYVILAAPFDQYQVLTSDECFLMKHAKARMTSSILGDIPIIELHRLPQPYLLTKIVATRKQGSYDYLIVDANHNLPSYLQPRIYGNEAISSAMKKDYYLINQSGKLLFNRTFCLSAKTGDYLIMPCPASVESNPLTLMLKSSKIKN